jgi:hypothetical protein
VIADRIAFEDADRALDVQPFYLPYETAKTGAKARDVGQQGWKS